MNIPPLTKQTIDDYVQHGWHPGSFVMAVLSNDLMGAFSAADDDNARHLLDIVQYVHFCIPLAAHGSKEIVESWMKYRKEIATELDDDLKKGGDSESERTNKETSGAYG